MSQEGSNADKKRDRTIMAAVIGAVAVIAAALITVFLSRGGNASNSSTSSATASATSTSSASPSTPSRAPASTNPPFPTASTCPSKLSLTGPAEDTSFTSGSNKALSITGTACNLGGDTGWLFDYDSDDHYYYDDYNGNAPAAAVPASQSGTWTYPDGGIGDSGDQNKPYTITLVLASPSCAKRLLTAPAIDGDHKWKSLPAGCTVVGIRHVYVTYP